MFKLQFDTDNAAFDGDSQWTEMPRILREVATNVEHGILSGVIRDINGNRIGAYETEGFE